MRLRRAVISHRLKKFEELFWRDLTVTIRVGITKYVSKPLIEFGRRHERDAVLKLLASDIHVQVLVEKSEESFGKLALAVARFLLVI